MPALDALRNHHFTFARQQWNGTHFAKVQSNRVVWFLLRSRCQIEFDMLGWKFLFRLYGTEIGSFRGITSGLGTGGIFVDIDAVALKGGKHFVNLLGGMHFGRENIVHLVVEQVAALLA